MLEECPVLGWAASGGMALTGQADGAPAASPAPAFGLLCAVAGELAAVTRAGGVEVRADPGELVAGRAALAGFSRRGRVSAGGSARLLRAADGWCAVNLSRDDDVAAVPAIIGALGVADAVGVAGVAGRPVGAEGAWGALEAAALGSRAEALAGAAQLLGVPAAALPPVRPVRPARPSPGRNESGLSGAGESGGWPPGRVGRIAARSAGARLAGAVVVDLSSMWAGPLCARLLGLAGADVIKVETPDRPDGARAGERRFFDWLHAGHRSVVLDFRAESGRRALAALLAAADVVIEASRPRALRQLGLAPELIPHRDGQVWLSITGYGRADTALSELVAFGDDAAVAGGLVGRTGDDGAPVFCADAIADPLTGLCGALAVARSVADGGGELIDLSMRAVAGCFAAAPALDHGPHSVRAVGTVGTVGTVGGGGGADAIVTCARLGLEQAVLPPRAPGLAGAGGGGGVGAAAAAAEMGADTAAVLAWLGTGSSGC
jgi:hypothetical protein